MGQNAFECHLITSYFSINISIMFIMRLILLPIFSWLIISIGSSIQCFRTILFLTAIFYQATLNQRWKKKLNHFTRTKGRDQICSTVHQITFLIGNLMLSTIILENLGLVSNLSTPQLMGYLSLIPYRILLKFDVQEPELES